MPYTKAEDYGTGRQRMWGEFAIFHLILHNTLHCTHAPLFQQEEERLSFKQLSDLAETFHKRTRETREQYNDFCTQVKELEQLRSQRASSGVVSTSPTIKHP